MSDTQNPSSTPLASVQRRELTVVETMRKMDTEFKAALPAHIPPERFTRVAQTAINNNPDLQKMTPRSVIAACMKAAEAGLLPDGREAAIVPFKGAATFMPMVAGIMKLVRNSGDVGVISVQVVKENDHFDYELGDDEFMKHKPALTKRGQTIGAYSIVTLKDGSKSREWMDIEQIEGIRKRSRSGGSGPWVTDFDEMARKTVFRRHAKRLPMSTDKDNEDRLQNAFAVDEEDNGLDPGVTHISTGKVVESAAAPGVKRQTRTAAAVKEAVATSTTAQTEEAPPTQPADSDVMDAEFEDVSNGEPALAGHGEEPPM